MVDDVSELSTSEGLISSGIGSSRGGKSMIGSESYSNSKLEVLYGRQALRCVGMLIAGIKYSLYTGCFESGDRIRILLIECDKRTHRFSLFIVR